MRKAFHKTCFWRHLLVRQKQKLFRFHNVRLKIGICGMLLFMTGCKEAPCYTGIGPTTVPKEFRMVERADAASFYQVDPNDARLISLQPLGQDVELDSQGHLVVPWTSCQDVDRFDMVHRVTMGSVKQQNEVGISESYMTCASLSFQASTNVDDLRFKIEVSNTSFGQFFSAFPLQSKIEAPPFVFQDLVNERDIDSKVLISHIVEEGQFAKDKISSWPYKKPKGGKFAFIDKGKEGGSPPFILVRLWSFRTPEAQQIAFDLFGDDITFYEEYGQQVAVCGDIYYGYFAK